MGFFFVIFCFNNLYIFVPLYLELQLNKFKWYLVNHFPTDNSSLETSILQMNLNDKWKQLSVAQEKAGTWAKSRSVDTSFSISEQYEIP